MQSLTIAPLEQRRKPGLGYYSGNRSQWKAAWHYARCRRREGKAPNAQDKGLAWKASLIAHFECTDIVDPLNVPAPVRLASLKIIARIAGKSLKELLTN